MEGFINNEKEYKEFQERNGSNFFLMAPRDAPDSIVAMGQMLEDAGVELDCPQLEYKSSLYLCPTSETPAIMSLVNHLWWDDEMGKLTAAWWDPTPIFPARIVQVEDWSPLLERAMIDWPNLQKRLCGGPGKGGE